jgi:hypothetical protein
MSIGSSWVAPRQTVDQWVDSLKRGPLIEENLEAWCSRCNFAQRAADDRDMRISPRAWQIEVLDPVVAQIRYSS